MADNDAVFTTVVCLVLAAKLVGNGIAGLSDWADAGTAVHLARQLPAPVAEPRRGGRADRVGRAGPRNVGLRLDRRSVAGRWPLRRATPLIWYAAFGSSRHLITGRMSATAALSAAAAGSTIEFKGRARPRNRALGALCSPTPSE